MKEEGGELGNDEAGWQVNPGAPGRHPVAGSPGRWSLAVNNQ
jgi:hypothetical protein